MKNIQISKDKLLELLYEAYQAGCFGYMELKETQCNKIADQCNWVQDGPVGLSPSETAVGLSPSETAFLYRRLPLSAELAMGRV